MRNFTLFIFALVVVILQLSVLDVFFGFQKSPNIVLALVVSLVVWRGFRSSLGWILLSGLLLGIGSGWLWGTSALLFVLIAWAVDGLNSFSDIKAKRLAFYPVFAVILVLSLFFYDLLGAGLYRLENHFWGKQAIASSFQMNGDFLWKAVFTVLSGFLIYFVIRKIDGFQDKSSARIISKAG